jgi:hypothetical protein
MLIESLVVDLSHDPFNPNLNFAVAKEYENQRQTASAVSFYLRTAEYGYYSHPEIVYQSLINLARCFDDQNDRLATVSNSLLQAIAYQPNMAEGYFWLSQFHERQKNWQECYTYSCIGLSIDADDFRLIFEKAVSAWWIGRAAESKKLFNLLLERDDIDTEYRAMIEYNLASI